jgi:hypothetical protein
MRQPTQGPHRGDDTRALWLMSIKGRRWLWVSLKFFYQLATLRE